MNEKRASKKQRELLNFIDEFIKTNDYGPSYREIMRMLDYKSVSTVAVHVNGLITCGLLRKTDNSARSLEVVRDAPNANPDAPHIAWLRQNVARLTRVERHKEADIIQKALDLLDQ